MTRPKLMVASVLAGFVALLIIIKAFQTSATATATAGTNAAPSDQVPSTPGVVAMRSVCPGSIAEVRRVVDEERASALEAAQAWAEDTRGFLGVVDDGYGPVIVVDRSSLEAWRQRAVGTNLRVAPSCVSERLVDGAQTAMAGLARGPGAFSSVGYDVLVDAVLIVTTFSEAEVLAAIEELVPDAEEAYAAGTLRIDRVPWGVSPRQ